MTATTVYECNSENSHLNEQCPAHACEVTAEVNVAVDTSHQAAIIVCWQRFVAWVGCVQLRRSQISGVW